MADQAACFLRCSFFLFFFKSVQREFQCKVHQFIKRNTFLLRDHRTTFYEIFAQSQVFQHIFLGRYCKCVFAAHKIISLSVCNFNMKIKSNICIKRYTKICMEICIIYEYNYFWNSYMGSRNSELADQRACYYRRFRVPIYRKNLQPDMIKH